MHTPNTIEKRIFTCEACGYSVQVYGETYFDSGCHNYMATFQCTQCKSLFESLISKLCYNEAYDDVYFELEDDFCCLSCGDQNANVWNKDTGKCPKCNEDMQYKVEGIIKVKHTSKELEHLYSQ